MADRAIETELVAPVQGHAWWPRDRAGASALVSWLLLAIILVLALAVRLPGFERPMDNSFFHYYVDESKILVNLTGILLGKPLLAHWPYALYYWLIPQVVVLYATFIPSILPYTTDVFHAMTLRRLIELNEEPFVLLTRLNMLAFSLGLVAMMFLYAKRCTGRWGAVAAALVVSFAPVAVNHARWAYYDTPMTFWYWLTVGGLVWTWQQRSLRGVYVCAALAAWTVTTKQNGAPIAFLWLVTMVPVVAWTSALPWYQAWRSRHFWLSGLLAVAIGLACYPTLLDPSSLGRLAFTAGSAYVEADRGLEARMWLSLINRQWPWQGPTWVLAILAAGLVPLLMLSRDRCLAAMCVAAAVGYYAIVGYSTQGNDRLILPLVPGLAMGLAGWMAVVERAITLRWARAVLSSAVIAALAGPLLYSTLKFNLLLTAADTRQEARHWLLENLPFGAKVATEPYAPKVPDVVPRKFTRTFAQDHGLEAFEVTRFNSVGVHAPTWYREQGFAVVVFADVMLGLALRQAQLGEYAGADAIRAGMGKGAYFAGLPLREVIETYGSLRRDSPAVIEFKPSPFSTRRSTVTDLRVQLQYHWSRSLWDLWARRDEIMLGPPVTIVKVQ